MARRDQPRSNPPSDRNAGPGAPRPAPGPYAYPAGSPPHVPGRYAYPAEPSRPLSGPYADARAAYPPAAYPAPPPARRHIPIGADIYNGAVRGDFAREIGGAGAVTQVVLGFTPGVGTLCALRDCVADWRKRDRVGLCLNLLALTPLLGGFPKTAQVLRAVHHVGRAVHVAHRRGRSDSQPARASAPDSRRTGLHGG